MSPLAAYGLLAHALIFGAITALLPLGPLRQKAALIATTTALLVGIAPTLHGVFGTPSVTLLALALLQLAGKTPSPLSRRPAMGILVFAAVFYASAWGAGPFDPYGLGYQPWPILAALIPIGVALWWRGMLMGLLILTIDLAAYATGIFPNLWDVLIDPLLVLLAASIVSLHLVLRFIATKNR
jgi:hypothetical protein